MPYFSTRGPSLSVLTTVIKSALENTENTQNVLARRTTLKGLPCSASAHKHTREPPLARSGSRPSCAWSASALAALQTSAVLYCTHTARFRLARRERGCALVRLQGLIEEMRPARNTQLIPQKNAATRSARRARAGEEASPAPATSGARSPRRVSAPATRRRPRASPAVAPARPPRGPAARPWAGRHGRTRAHPGRT